MSGTVFVSGATGFIAQHIVKDLIGKGYKVIGTVRSTEKGDTLKANLNSDKFIYEIVKDIAEPNAFDEVFEKHNDVKVVLHTASPFHYNAKDIKKELLSPAVDGTLNVLKSIQKHAPQVTRVVVTSSFAAVGNFGYKGDKSKLPPYTEESFNPITEEEALSSPLWGYIGSKTFAERAAWEFVKTEKPNFALNTVNPALVSGPQAFDSNVSEVMNTSSEILNKILKLKPDDPVPGLSAGYADVRDVSKAHIHAFESDVTGFRYLLYNGPCVGQTVLDIANKIPQLKGKLPVGEPGAGEEIAKGLSKIDNSKTLGYIGDIIPLEKSVTDTLEQILKVRGSI